MENCEKFVELNEKCDYMVKIDKYEIGDSTIEIMNNLANYLLRNNMIIDDSGVQESSEALCNFEVHIIRRSSRILNR